MRRFSLDVVIGCLVIVLLTGCAPTPGATVAPSQLTGTRATTNPRVVVLGDSLAVSPSADQGFPSALQARIERANLRWAVTNAGVRGDTTAGGLARVDELLGPEVGVLVVALGANDGLRGIDPAVVEANLSSIVERATARNIDVLLCAMEMPPLHGWDYTVAFHRVFARVADRYDVPLAPFLLFGVALIPDMNGDDLIHPNAAGARRIADNLWPFLEPLLRARRPTRRDASIKSFDALL
jgi:acyl-CoA thioesterase-1